jgi:cytochrome c-type biogenesis protein CcmH
VSAGGGGSSSGGGGSSGGLDKPKPPKPPEKPKPEKQPAPSIAQPLKDAAQLLSDGAEMTDAQVQSLVRNGLAKLDKDGNAGPPEPGDMEGEHKGNPVMVGQSGVDIIIDKVH